MNGFPTTPQTPELAQPGGGWGMRVEMAWAAVRRCLLRLVRPGYVRLMAERRQGACPSHADRVVDYRDLKYIRPSCPVSFPDSPHLGQPYLGFARYGLCELFVFTWFFLGFGAGLTALALAVHWIFWVPFGALALVWLEIVWFFRDPPRTAPADPGILVSPADGTITHIEEVEEIEFPGKCLRISMFLSIFNVHVNRAPASARVTQVRYFPGAFLDARDVDSAIRNEQLWIDATAEEGGFPLRVKQISGKVARRIVCWLRPDDAIKRGERIGMIKLGSRTDLILPLERVADVCVKVGDKVRGARTRLVRLKPTVGDTAGYSA